MPCKLQWDACLPGLCSVLPPFLASAAEAHSREGSAVGLRGACLVEATILGTTGVLRAGPRLPRNAATTNVQGRSRLHVAQSFVDLCL